MQQKYPELQQKYPKFNQKLEKFERDLCELRKQHALPQPQPKEYLFAEVPGYTKPDSSFHAAYNLLAVLNFIFLASTNRTLFWNATSVTQKLFGAVNLLQQGEIVTDELTDEIATVCQEFFSNTNNIDEEVKGYLSSRAALNGDSVAIFKLFGHLFELARRRYTLTKLEQQIANLSQQIHDGVLPEAAKFDLLHQTACAALLPIEGKPAISFLDNPIQFSEDCKIQSDKYIATITALTTECFDKNNNLTSVKQKFLQQRETCIGAINSVTSQLSALATEFTELQKSIAEKREQASQIQLPPIPLVEEIIEQTSVISLPPVIKSPQLTLEAAEQTPNLDEMPTLTLEELSPPTTPDLDSEIVLPTLVTKPVITTSSDISALEQQLTAVDVECLKRETELQKLIDKQSELTASKAVLETSVKKLVQLSEQQSSLTTRLSRLTSLKTAIKQDQLTYEDSDLEVICTLLNTDESTLTAYLYQQSGKTNSWAAWGWDNGSRALKWVIGSNVGPSYEEQKNQFVETLKNQIKSAKTEQTRLSATIHQCQTDKAKLSELTQQLNLLTNTIEAQKKTQNELQKQCEDLQTTLQQAKLNSAQQKVSALLVSGVSIAYHETCQKLASKALPVQSNTEESLNTSASAIAKQPEQKPHLEVVNNHLPTNIANIPEQDSTAETDTNDLLASTATETDAIEADFVFVLDPLETKRKTLDDAEKAFEDLIDTEEKVGLLAILIAFFTYIKALLDYHTEEIDIKASLKKAKDEIKSALDKPITLPVTLRDSLFFKPEPETVASTSVDNPQTSSFTQPNIPA